MSNSVDVNECIRKALGINVTRKLVFISPSFTVSHAFHSTPKEAFEDFMMKESVDTWDSLIMLYGDWVVYRKIDHSKLETVGRIKAIFGCD